MRQNDELVNVHARSLQQMTGGVKVKFMQIKKHQEKYSDPKQLKFDFGDDEGELRQLESNKRYWSKRLDMLDEELKTEPRRIKDLYEIKASRLEPIGLIYLWPATG